MGARQPKVVFLIVLRNRLEQLLVRRLQKSVGGFMEIRGFGGNSVKTDDLTLDSFESVLGERSAEVCERLGLKKTFVFCGSLVRC